MSRAPLGGPLRAPSVPAAFWLLVLGPVACAARATGMVQSGEGGPALIEPEGRRWRLELTPATADLAWMDGEVVDVEGRARGRRLRADGYVLREGTHGLQAFSGVIARSDGVLGLQDRASGWFLPVGGPAAAELARWVGTPMVVEGYSEGARGLRVVYYRVLAPVSAPP